MPSIAGLVPLGQERVVALATGAVVANDYYSQSLEDTLAREFNATTGAVGLVITLI